MRHERKDELPGIENRRRGIAQQGHPAVLAGVPQRQPARFPLALDLEVERVVVPPDVAIRELFPREQDRPVAEDQEAQQTSQSDDGHHGSTHQGRSPRHVPRGQTPGTAAPLILY